MHQLIGTYTFLIISANLYSSAMFQLVKDRKPAAEFILTADLSTAIISNFYFFNSELQKCGCSPLPLSSNKNVSLNQIEFIITNLQFKNRDRYNVVFPDAKTMRVTATETSVRWVINWLLEEAGVRYPMPGDNGSWYPRITDVKIPATNFTITPPYNLYRGVFGLDKNWCLALNSENTYTELFFNHGIDNLFPIEKYAKGEWIEKIMPVKKGSRLAKPSKWHWMPCLSDPATVEEAVKNICAYFAAHPEQKTYSISCNDGITGFCECEACEEANSALEISDFCPLPALKSASGSYYRWVNSVAKAVMQKYPDNFLGLLAYNNVVTPPDEKLCPNVAVAVCFDPVSCADADSSKRFNKLLSSWTKVASHVGVWNYNYGLLYYSFPRFYGQLQTSVLQKNGGIGFSEASVCATDCLKHYLFLKSLFNLSIDVNKITRDWCNACVGKDAAPFLEKYYLFLNDYWTVRVPKTAWFQSSKYATYLPLNINGNYVYALKNGDLAACRSNLERLIELTKAHGDRGQQFRAALIMSEYELHEAWARSVGAEILSVDGAIENSAQALEIAKAIPQMCRYSEKSSMLSRQILSSFPPWWLGQFKGFTVSIFTNAWFPIEVPSCIMLLSEFTKNQSVNVALNTSLSDPAIPETLRGNVTFMGKIICGKVENILDDGSFENGNDDWMASGKLDGERFASGSQSLKLAFYANDKYIMTKRNVPMKPKTRYYLSAKVFIFETVPPGKIKAEAYLGGVNDENVYVTYYIPTQVELVPGSWTTVSTVYTSGNCSGRGELTFRLFGVTMGEYAYIDDVFCCVMDE